MPQIPLLDTNILIGLVNGTESSPEELSISEAAASVMSVMELYALAGIAQEESRRIEAFLQGLTLYPVSESIARRAGILARTRRRGIVDYVIAATALEFNLPLMTHNVKDFRNIPGLKLMKLD